jgi:hypothetical protein
MDRKDIRKLNKGTDLLSGQTLSCDRRVRRGTAIFLMLFCFVLWCSSIGAAAAQNDAEDRGTVMEAETDKQSGAAVKAVPILVEGTFEKPDRDGILARINEIRREACEEGVRDPATGEPMRAEDYVPLVWSYELEEAAARRAVESTILRDHVRPDGTECFTILPDSEAFSMETLAWGYGGILEAIEGWYSEKSSYVEETGAPAGHYMALISPSLRYAAAADFQPGAGQDACAGAFGRSDPSEAAMNPQGTSAEETAAALLSQTGWEIHLDKTVLPYVAQLALARTARLIAKGIWNMD